MDFALYWTARMDSRKQLTFRQLVQMIRTWATTPADGTETLEISLIKSGSQVTQVDIRPKTTTKGVMTID